VPGLEDDVEEPVALLKSEANRDAGMLPNDRSEGGPFEGDTDEEEDDWIVDEFDEGPGKNSERRRRRAGVQKDGHLGLDEGAVEVIAVDIWKDACVFFLKIVTGLRWAWHADAGSARHIW
jgi:hypothetical protein